MAANDSIAEQGSEHNSESIATQPRSATDRAVPRIADAELSGSLRGGRNAGIDRGLESFGLLVGADDVGMRSPTGGTSQATADAFEITAGQDLGVVRLQAFAIVGDASDGNAQGRFVLDAARECVAVWETGIGEEPCVVCAGPAVDPAGTQPVVHDLRDAGAAVVDCQTRPATAEAVQATIELRRFDHRRLGLRPADSRGDGSSVHVAGRTLRTRQRAANQQLGVQQVGSDIQGHHDDRRRDRPTGTPQRNHRNERAQLPNRDSEKVQHQESKGLFPRAKQKIINFFNGSSNCR